MDRSQKIVLIAIAGLLFILIGMYAFSELSTYIISVNAVHQMEIGYHRYYLTQTVINRAEWIYIIIIVYLTGRKIYEEVQN